jgi:4-amino-4-deoxy-L-arabinose transferase-like glycosyltransferase
MKRGTFLAVLVLTAFLIRFGMVWALRDLSEGPTLRHGADGVEYNSLALQVANGNGYVGPSGHPTSFRAPGFPLFLAALYFVAGPDYPLIYVVFCLLGALSCLLTYLLACELVPEGTARIAAVLAAVYFPLIYYASMFASENVFVPCLALCVWLFLRHLRTRSIPALALAGLALGWAALTRPFALLLVPVLLGLLVGHQVRVRRLRPLAPVVLVVAFLAILLPWTVRNYLAHDRLVLVATNGGSTFYGGNNDLVLSELRYLGNWVTTVKLPGRDLIEATPDEVSHDQMEWQLGWQWCRQHLRSLPLLWLYKFCRLWLPDLDSANRSYVLAQVLGYSPFLVLFVLGLVRRLRYGWSTPWLVIDGALMATILTGLIFWGSPRFRDANAPLLMAFAALGWQVIVLRKTKSRDPFTTAAEPVVSCTRS